MGESEKKELKINELRGKLLALLKRQHLISAQATLAQN
jgi:hypothetical protein